MTTARMRGLALLLALAGLALLTALVVWSGAGGVLSVLGRVQPGAFIAYCLYTLANLALLGVAWFVLAAQPTRALPAFLWGRVMREAASDVLPFSQVGGLIAGARAAATHGVPERTVIASLVADVTVELAAQLVYTLAAVAAIAWWLSAAGPVLGWALAGLAVSGALAATVTLTQGAMLGMAARLAARLYPQGGDGVAGVRATLAAIYRRRGALGLSFALHLLTWAASGAGAWLALRLLGVAVPVWAVLTIEGLVFALRTVAFAIPGGVGVQEGAYVLLGPLFGLPPEVALSLSLVKRARDLAIGVPAMLIFQLDEGRRLLR